MQGDSDHHELITRRDAILRVSALLGGVALVGQSAMLAGCDAPRSERRQRKPDGGLFTQRDVEFLDEIAETILPETSTPGAKAAGVGPFIAMMVTDCYDAREQKIFLDGLQQVDERSREMHDSAFLSATPAQRVALLEQLDAEQLKYMQAQEDEDEYEADTPAHYFRMMKELALLGYFTSEIGYNQAMRYAETPGRFDPCMPYEPDGRAWAPHA